MNKSVKMGLHFVISGFREEMFAKCLLSYKKYAF